MRSEPYASRRQAKHYSRCMPRLPLLFLLPLVALGENVTNFTPPAQLDVGINLSPMATDGDGVDEWKQTATRVFRDLFKHASPWAVERASFENGVRAETWKTYGLRATNMTYSAGYPWELPRWYKWTSNAGGPNAVEVTEQQSAVAYIGWGGAHVEAGLYAVHYDGNGTLTFGGDAAEVAGTRAHDASSMRGRYVFNVSSPSGGVEVRITYTDPSAPLHRLRIVRVRDEVLAGGSSAVDVDATDAALESQPFHSSLLSVLSGVRVLRFCGWMRIDGNDYNDNNFRPAWRDRATMSTLTQAGPRGVAVEYMVALANALNASAWFCMPRSNAMAGQSMSHPNRPGEADQADLQAYARYVHESLHPHLSALVEYRTDARSSSEQPQAHAIESLEIFRAWSSAFGADAQRAAQLGTRLVRVSAAGAWLEGTLARFGTDIGNVDAVALRASFGELCPHGTLSRFNQCVEFDDRERAPEYYANWTVDALLGKVEESALFAEAKLNAQVQLLHSKGIRLLTDVGGPRLAAASYGARASLAGARRCQQCHRTQRGNKYGTEEFAALSTSSGYVRAAQWHQLFAYEGITSAARALVATDETGQPTYWRHVGESNTSECARLCDAGGHECTGFVHQRTGEWSCGVTYHNDCPGAGSGFNGGGLCYERNGGCAVPGTCYFFNNQTYSQHGTREVTPDESGALMRRDVFWKGIGKPGSSPHLLDDATAGARCADDCFGFYRGDAKAQADTDRSAFTLDVLAANMSEFEWIARLEQSLETKLLSCNAHPRMREILLDFLERWRGIGGSVFVAQPLYRPPVLCETGGKSCGHEALMLGPDDTNSSKLQAIVGYNLGLRSTLPTTAAQARAMGIETFPPGCAPSCIWGTCVQGACRCYLGVEGEACDRITGAGQPNACAARGTGALGMNVAGISDWSRSWVYVDVFKAAREWCHMLLTDYNCRSDLSPPLEISPAIGGYPARLAPNHRACAMMVRDLETHYVSGAYTVLYEGDGTLEFSLDTDYVRRVRSGYIEVDVTLSTDQNNGIYLCITRTNAQDPLRRIRVMTPGYARSGALKNAEPEFHPAFLHALRKFHHLRFMDWSRANDEEASSMVEWADRAREADDARTHSYAATRGSVPYESMIRLSNVLGALPWLTLPHNASDGYVRELAQLLNATLRPDLGVVISLSNEMWHSGCDQHLAT